ncbi:unnamed protein product [Pipistrellus nathusii]|uniref:Uncharacterized protein n=1 Tax=Pipistrellus nathusii TaxID=59473 RepID=A0ABN9ZKY2_PIPNA
MGVEEHRGSKWGRSGDPRPARSPRLTQVRVLQNAVRYVGRVAVQVPAFLAEKDLAELTTPAARLLRLLGLQHARLLLRGVPPPAVRPGPLTLGAPRRARGAPLTGPPAPGSPSPVRPAPAPPHRSASAAGPRSRAKGSSQLQKPLSARRSSATCWALGSWRSGLYDTVSRSWAPSASRASASPCSALSAGCLPSSSSSDPDSSVSSSRTPGSSGSFFHKGVFTPAGGAGGEEVVP